MTPELAYFLKINVGIALFYAFYRLFFYKDTFFRMRRTALLCFFGISLIYPMFNLQELIKAHEPMVVMADLYATNILPEITFDAVAAPTGTDWQEVITFPLKAIYWGGTILLLTRFMAQLISIIHLRFRCKREEIQGVQVYVLNKENGPFSFFNWIFIHPKSHAQEELAEILTHELTHARQCHSVDAVFSELMCIIFWFNPFTWLMKREVRNNLEYMADSHVLQNGHDYKTYQYHLLGLTHHKAAATLYNSFNVLPLKNRIKMMNKKRTKEIGRTKYLIFLPLAALLLIVSNIEAVARTTKDFAKEVIQTVEGKTQIAEADQPVVYEATEPTNSTVTLQQEKAIEYQEVVADEKAKGIANDTINKDMKENDVFDVVEQMPAFSGGIEGLREYLSENVRYPVKAQEAGTQGRVIVQFIVEKDGQVSNCSIGHSVSPELDAEATRVVAAMPRWIPGKQRGKEVRVKFTVPIAFKLSGPKAEEIKNSDLSEVVVVGYAPKEEEAGTPDKVIETAEEMPKYYGGASGLMNYLARSIKYPIDAQQSKKQGRVIVQMTIDKNGRVTDPKILQSVSPSLDAEAIRVIMGMPRWEPGKDKGETVAVRYTLPIIFKLQ